MIPQVTTPLPAKIPSLTTTQPPFPSNPKALILKQCKTQKDLNKIHAHLIKTQLLLDPSIAENILEAYAILVPNSLDHALSIFDKIPEPDAAAYSVMIRGLTLRDMPFEAVLLFQEMEEESVLPDEFTFPSILKACSKLGALSEGEQIHAQSLKLGLGSGGFIGNTLIRMYGCCGKIESARKVFDQLGDRDDVVAWNAMYAGYSKSGYWEEVVKLFEMMRELQIQFDEVTMICVLTACGRIADLKMGKWIADYTEENGIKKSVNLMTCLVDMYAKCGCLDVARRYFDQMERKDVIAWSAMISGYAQARQCQEALNLFREMQEKGLEPNEVTLVSVLSSCAVLGALETGKWVHFFSKRKRLKPSLPLGTVLIDFYAKCGSIDDAVSAFMEMPIKTVYSWTAVIQGLANNGQGKRALKFFHQMRESGVSPNDVTFTAMLSACSHAGLVGEGRELFISMVRDFDIDPTLEHYGCMVDILGRAGLIEEAYQFIQSMPIKPNAVIWRTLLASCRAHADVKIGEESVKHLVELEPLHSGDYILLSNIYATVGRLEDAKTMRSKFREKGIKKSPGCSLIELDGVVHELFSEDDTHSNSKEIYRAVEEMMKKIKCAGYIPITSDARIDAEDDDKEVSVSHHSEKLAIAFALISTPPGTTVRISKNLRVCSDCHNATKIISKVYDRGIIIRDRNRFHHFRDGICSCNDYW